MIKTLKTWIPSALLVAGIVLAGHGHAGTEKITYFHNDISGTPMLATDATGAVVWKENYRPYGEKLNKPAAGADNKVGFAGKPFDNNTGLSYMGARYYDPVLGRFTGIDPKEVDPRDLHSFNRYAYANNNPYKFVDPDGWEPIDAIKSWWNSSIAGFKSEGPAEAAMRMLQGLPVEGAAIGVVGAIKAARAAEHSVGAVRGAEKAAEAAKSLNVLKDGAKLPTDKALGAAIEHLGPGYKEIAPGVFKSADGNRMIRMTESDLAKSGNHAGAPHLNFETGRTVVKPNGKEQFISQENKHIFLPQEK